MSNEYRCNAARDAVATQFAQLEIPLRWTDTASPRPIDEPIKPTDRATMIRPIDPEIPRAGLEGADVRWWMVPYFHKGDVRSWKMMSTNAPLETVDTSPTFREAYKRRRALIPTTSFIEYAEPPGWKKGRPKTRHEITWPGGEIRYFAGLWDQSSPSDMADGLTSFCFITGPGCPDLAPIHDRTPAILTLEQGLAWLDLDGAGKAAFSEPAPAGAYTVTVSPREQIMSAAMRRALP
ncbi:SOS response-associated peptidase family protein [Phenylobacterium sp. LjRoot219]|uniref:SOS response-associated peptidase n=1 Tax=Phenylobacterium sp. LjRoot219 TaxID=3342283 RepID=UPI003ECFD77E